MSLMLAQTNDTPWLFALFNITSWWGVAWVTLGFAGQFMFAMRLTVQWLVSEKHRKSIVPASYWWLSVFGASMLTVYFIWRMDIVGVLGQCFGWLIYIRNLYFIYQHKPNQEVLA